MTHLWKAGIAAGGAGAGILIVLAVLQVGNSWGQAALLVLGALALVAASATLVLRPGAGVDAGPDWRLTAFTIFLLTLAFGLMIGGGTHAGHSSHG
ncbi:MAG: hypothetical protein H0U90_10240 [Actinobacteria bacterium]|nr:hypothetical protein [Actinomycetota bacterium]